MPNEPIGAGLIVFDVDQRRRLRSSCWIMSRAFRGWWRGIVLLWKTLGHQTGGPIFAGGEIEWLALPFCITRIAALYPRYVVA
jgi:hypothetical protein